MILRCCRCESSCVCSQSAHMRACTTSNHVLHILSRVIVLTLSKIAWAYQLRTIAVVTLTLLCSWRLWVGLNTRVKSAILSLVSTALVRLLEHISPLILWSSFGGSRRHWTHNVICSEIRWEDVLDGSVLCTICSDDLALTDRRSIWYLAIHCAKSGYIEFVGTWLVACEWINTLIFDIERVSNIWPDITDILLWKASLPSITARKSQALIDERLVLLGLFLCRSSISSELDFLWLASSGVVLRDTIWSYARTAS